MNFVKKNFNDLFNGIGTFPTTYKILLKEDAIPIAKPPRRVPLALVDKLKIKLNELEKNKIISKVDNGTEWVSHIVTVEKKDGSIRICLDPAELNKNILDESFLLPTLEELSTKLNEKKYFSVLDLKDGFWHVKLDEESQKLCTFTTPFGNYKFLRMPFGIKTGPQVFQKKNYEIFGNIENVAIYMDDILITGKNLKEHDETLLKVLNRARENKVKFNLNKMKIAVEKVRYLGHIFSENSIVPDPDRIEALNEIKYPKDKTDLRKFLGMINYVRSFVPKLAEITAPLRELLKKNVIFAWTEQHAKAIDEIKKQVIESQILVPFDTNKSIIIQCDASKNGLGCCMLQDGKPISFASRSLTDCEKNYSQIEKEFLSILFACQKFHFFTYGRKVKVENDHKPLLGIIKKEIHKIPSSKLRAIRLKLLNYNVNLEYAPGKTIHIADYLSRYMKETNEKGEDELLMGSILSINVSDERKTEFRRETENDPTLKILKTYCQNGWPGDKSKCDDLAKFYFKMKSDIFLEDDMLFYEERIIIPIKMRDKILKQLHESHFGITKTLKRAKQTVYWPNMCNDITQMIGNCMECQKYAPKNQKEPMIPHEIPDKPFEKVACDILEYSGKNYLVVVDFYSKWIELKQMRGKTAREVNEKLMEIFCVFGRPKIIIADNMPFGSVECTEFANRMDIKFITSSPHYPKSNGLAERSVQICKNILKKTNNFFEVQNALLEYRSTPTQFMNYSPSQLLQSRVLRSGLPTHVNKFELKVCPKQEVQQQLQKKQTECTKYYNRNAKSREQFNPNDNVYVHNFGRWVPGVVIKKWSTPRSYVVSIDGKSYRRNTRDIRHRDGMEDVDVEPDNSPFSNSRETEFPRHSLRSGRHY